ncbi:NACHT domain-containing protein [Actinoplanes sp. GCM10030250]|uniref:NACHT domain-containing protein n=1 Tax=Actinoplanes sp. GCM10030250 TaxID=3273376 RepID=UPI00361652C3
MPHDDSDEAAERPVHHIDARNSQGLVVGDGNRVWNTFTKTIRVRLGRGRAGDPSRLTPDERRRAEEQLQLLSAALEREDFAVLADSTGPGPLPFTLTDSPSLVRNADRVRSERAGGPLPPDTTLESRFAAASRRLLIVGGVGAGKTTALTLLARHLWLAITGPGPDGRILIRGKRVPVILRLSRWTDNRRPFGQWMAGELSSIYNIDRKVARVLVSHGMVLPMLDGLDEVAGGLRAECVQEINNFTDLSGGPPPLVVTCRIDDYDPQSPLRLLGAILIEPLTGAQAEERLAAQPGTKALLTAYREDPVARGLLRTPLFLQLALEVAVDHPGQAAPVMTADEIVTSYVDKLFGQRQVENRAGRPRFRDPQLRGWLAALAGLPKPHGALFVPDELDSTVFRSTANRSRLDRGLPILAGCVTGTVVTVGTLTSFIPPWITGTYVFALLMGLIAGLVVDGICRRAHPVGQRLEWSWSRALEWFQGLAAVTVGGVVAVFVGLALWKPVTFGSGPAFVLLAAALVMGRGLVTTGGSEEAAPDSALRVSRRNAGRVWMFALAGVAAFALVIVGVNAAVNGFVSRAWLVGADSAVIILTYGALVGGVVSGLAVLFAPKRTGWVTQDHPRPSRHATWPARVNWHLARITRRCRPVLLALLVLIALPAGPLLDFVLLTALTPLRIPAWLGNLVLVVVLTSLGWAAARAGARDRLLARPAGTLLTSYSLTLIVRLLRPDANRNQLMYLMVTLLLAVCIALALRGGGSAWLRQHSIRILLSREKTLPRDLLSFLDDAENRGLLKRLGRGYEFRHEVIREHLLPAASRPVQESR